MTWLLRGNTYTSSMSPESAHAKGSTSISTLPNTQQCSGIKLVRKPHYSRVSAIRIFRIPIRTHPHWSPKLEPTPNLSLKSTSSAIPSPIVMANPFNNHYAHARDPASVNLPLSTARWRLTFDTLQGFNYGLVNRDGHAFIYRSPFSPQQPYYSSLAEALCNETPLSFFNARGAIAFPFATMAPRLSLSNDAPFNVATSYPALVTPQFATADPSFAGPPFAIPPPLAAETTSPNMLPPHTDVASEVKFAVPSYTYAAPLPTASAPPLALAVPDTVTSSDAASQGPSSSTASLSSWGASGGVKRSMKRKREGDEYEDSFPVSKTRRTISIEGYWSTDYEQLGQAPKTNKTVSKEDVLEDKIPSSIPSSQTANLPVGGLNVPPVASPGDGAPSTLTTVTPAPSTQPPVASRFVCCGHAFKQLSDFTKHQRKSKKHHAVPKYPCGQEGCTSKFRRSDTRNTHWKKYHPETG
ncbi:hypothetical protein EW146_g2148 [Bondarzewia mesenterica]|uniref:C2H2-type domain-containing protein n=1 Tax=Bondarzewia mesenterica TaxID=1095465 RepID=A0A4S4M311_9AGAM|nr:hypothetical protein EW146_g2148 [Bondarzewia mesenterica]